MTHSYASQIAKYCQNRLPLADARLSDEYYYHSLPLCVIDAVFSIGVKYSSTRNTVERFCRYAHTPRYRDHGSDYPRPDQQMTITDFLAHLGGRDFQHLAEDVFGKIGKGPHLAAAF